MENGIITMIQQTYIRKLLDNFGMKVGKRVVCMDVNICLQKAEKCNEGEFPYCELDKISTYLETSTRYDTANIVIQFSLFLMCYEKLNVMQ